MDKKIKSEYSTDRKSIRKKVTINDLATGQLLQDNRTNELAVIRQNGINCNRAKIVYIGRESKATVELDVYRLLELINSFDIEIVTKFRLEILRTY